MTIKMTDQLKQVSEQREEGISTELSKLEKKVSKTMKTISPESKKAIHTNVKKNNLKEKLKLRWEEEKLKLLWEENAKNLVAEYRENPWVAKIIANYPIALYKLEPIFVSDLALHCKENPKQKGGLILSLEDEQISIPPKSPLLQVLQIYLLTLNYNIADGNKKSSLQSIDGYFANDSLDSLKSYQRDQQKEKDAQYKMESERIALENKWLKDVFWDFKRKLEENSKELPELQRERSLRLGKGNYWLDSYGQRTYLDIKKGILRVGTNQNTLEFPLKLTLDQDSVTETFSRNETNSERLQRFYGLANILNRAQYLSAQISNKKADNYRPFHIDRGIITPRIEVENGMKDFPLIKVENLEPYAKVFKMDISRFAKILVDFLNKVHESNYRKLPTSQAQWNGGGRVY